MNEVNILFGDKKSFDDFGLRLLEIHIGFPDAKTNMVDIPGADGSLDLTDVLGETAYKNRTLEFVFDAMGAYENWHSLCSQIAGCLHGRRIKVILDTDPSYYYVGRLSLDTEKSDDVLHELVVSGEMDPYKYELQSSLEDWLWDSFSFETGIIREYRDLVVNGSRTLIVPGLRKPIVLTIISNANMAVTFEGKIYDVRPGTQKIYAIVLKEGDNELIFSGNGVISVDYRGGIL